MDPSFFSNYLVDFLGGLVIGGTDYIHTYIHTDGQTYIHTYIQFSIYVYTCLYIYIHCENTRIGQNRESTRIQDHLSPSPCK